MPMNTGHILPEIYGVREIDFPDIAAWPVGSEHYIVCKVSVSSKHEDMESGVPQKISGSLKILSIRGLSTQPMTAAEYETADFQRAKNEALQNANLRMN